MRTYDEWKLEIPDYYEADDSLTLKEKRDIVLTDLSKKNLELEKELGIYITEIETDSGEIVGVEMEEQ